MRGIEHETWRKYRRFFEGMGVSGRDGGRPTEADYRASARRWWARDWDVLTRCERRRLSSRPAQGMELGAGHAVCGLDEDDATEQVGRRVLSDLLRAAPIRSIARRATGPAPQRTT
jgi:hypothetical protein